MVEEQKKCVCCEKPSKIYYFHCEGGLDNRNLIADMLEKFNFEWVDMTGGQAAFKPKGNFNTFKRLIEIYADIHNIKVYYIKHCEDPGLGLCFPPKYFDQCNPETNPHPLAYQM